jgi:hypothetical protein
VGGVSLFQSSTNNKKFPSSSVLSLLGGCRWRVFLRQLRSSCISFPSGTANLLLCSSLFFGIQTHSHGACLLHTGIGGVAIINVCADQCSTFLTPSATEGQFSLCGWASTQPAWLFGLSVARCSFIKGSEDRRGAIYLANSNLSISSVNSSKNNANSFH